MIEYRLYQQQILNKIIGAIQSGYKKILVVSPTGSGKTAIIEQLLNYLVATYDFSHNLVTVPFVNLRDQIQGKMDDSTQVTTMHSAVNNLYRIKDIDVLIVDECHHIASPEYRKIPEYANYKFLFGFTATPFRADCAPLLACNGGLFDFVVEGPSIKELTDLGYLADLVYYTYPLIKKTESIKQYSDVIGVEYTLEREYYEIDNKEETIVEEYRESFEGISTIVFCKTVDHSRYIASKFLGDGINAASMNCYQPKWKNKSILEKFKSGDCKILTVCNAASEGLDLPRAKLGILARPVVTSLALYIQQIGRILRPYNNEKAYILDIVGNIYKYGHIYDAVNKEVL